MEKLKHEDLYSLEEYDRIRPEYRERMRAHKARRQVQVGPHVTFHFEDRDTMQYQVQEMLRIERIFEHEGIQDELDAYNPLIPDGRNLKATMMIEYPDPEERRKRLAELKGIERDVWMQVDDLEKVHPIANEDLERETEDKTSSVHFMRFEFTPEMIEKLRAGAPLRIGIDHPGYTAETEITGETREALLKDFD